jgi:putative intracellular protease/amidase
LFTKWFDKTFLIKNLNPMKRLFCLLILGSILVSFDKSAPKVLIIIRDGSTQLEYMLTNEIGQMQVILKQAGFDATIAAVTGELIKAGSVSMKPDIKISDVNLADYDGLLIPCLTIDTATPEVMTLVKSAAAKNMPIAAQAGGVMVLAKAGLLDGKKYCLNMDPGGDPDFKNGVYGGTGVIRDGNVITSGICPWLAKQTGNPDGTTKLTQTLVEVIKAK